MLNVQNILKDHLLVIEMLNVFKQLEGQNGALGLRLKTVIPMISFKNHGPKQLNLKQQEHMQDQ